MTGEDEWGPVAERMAGSTARRFAFLCDRRPSIGVDDLRQEALLAILLKSRDMGRPPSPGEAFVIAKRAMVDLARRQAMRWNPRGESFTIHDLDLIDDPPPADARLDVQGAVAALRPQCRRAVARKLEGWRNPEIAEADGVAVKAVVERVYRARRDLRRTLAAYAPDHERGSQ